MKLDKKVILYLVFGLVFLTVPTLAKMGIILHAHVTIIGTTLILSIAALGLNVLLGHSGLISLGTAGFMGLAAYISAYFTTTLKLPFEVALIFAVVVPTLIGILIGMMSLKIEGIYLAIATLAVAEIFRTLFLQLDVVTGGASGLKAKYPTFLNFIGKGFPLKSVGMYYFIVVVMVIVFILIHYLLKGDLGRSLDAMRGSEAAASAMGINIYKYRLIAFGVSTALASVSGVLYVHHVGISLPNTWTLALSLTLLAIIVVGGFRSIEGTLLGAFLLYGVPEVFLKPIALIKDVIPVAQGVLMILFIMFYPNGVIYVFYKFKNSLAKRKRGEVNNG